MTNDPAPHRDDLDVPGPDRLDPTERRRVTELGRRVSVPDGWSMVRQGEPADEAWLVLDGTVRVVADGRHVADVGPGGFTGEMGLVDRRLRREIPAFDDVVTESTAWRHAERD